jgi:hypothetical protein
LVRVLHCQYELFLLNLKTDHTVLSVFKFKAEGTNYSSKQRVACLFQYVASVMAASAVFYGVRQKGIGDVTSSMIISVLSTLPVFVCRTLFRKSRPQAIAAKLAMPVDHVPDFELEISLAKLERSDTFQSAMNNIASIAKKDTTLKDVDAAFAKIASSTSVYHQREFLDLIREVLLSKLYPYPRGCTKLSWGPLAAWMEHGDDGSVSRVRHPI